MKKTTGTKQKPLAHGASPVIDAHAHVGVDWPEEHVFASVDDCLKLMDLCGIDRACTSQPSFLSFDFREGNRITRDVVRQHPDRFIGFCVPDPRRPKESAEEIDRCLGDDSFRGLKLHVSFSGVPYDDPSYDPIYAKALQHRVPILAHTFNREEVIAFLSAARRFPEVPFIVGHSGGYAWANALNLIAAVPNAYFDLCCSCQDAGRVEAMVAVGGAKRVIFGTDLPLLHPACDLSPVVHARISEVDRALILGGNILRLLGEEP